MNLKFWNAVKMLSSEQNLEECDATKMIVVIQLGTKKYI